MKVKRNINRVAIIVALNLSLALMVGCMSPVSDKNLSSSEQISKGSLKEQVEDKKRNLLSYLIITHKRLMMRKVEKK